MLFKFAVASLSIPIKSQYKYLGVAMGHLRLVQLWPCPPKSIALFHAIMRYLSQGSGQVTFTVGSSIISVPFKGHLPQPIRH